MAERCAETSDPFMGEDVRCELGEGHEGLHRCHARKPHRTITIMWPVPEDIWEQANA